MDVYWQSHGWIQDMLYFSIRQYLNALCRTCFFSRTYKEAHNYAVYIFKIFYIHVFLFDGCVCFLICIHITFFPTADLQRYQRERRGLFHSKSSQLHHRNWWEGTSLTLLAGTESLQKGYQVYHSHTASIPYLYTPTVYQLYIHIDI